MNIQKQLHIKIENPETKNILADAFYPESQDKLPLVVFAHGYKGYKDWGAWSLMAEEFAKAGFFFVKFNFSHNGTTLEKPNEFGDLEAFGENNFSKEMSDFKAVLDYFSRHDNVDSDHISIIGHSRGGGVAVLTAFEDERVKKLITFAGVSNFKYRFPNGERLEKWKEEGVMYSENMRTHQQMPHYFQYYENFLANEDRFNIQYAAQHLEKPFLIIQGTDDDAVKEKEAHLLHEWCKTSELLLVEGANHVFGAKEPWQENQLPEHLDFITQKAIDFINKH